jgi:hypothetical protein
MQEDGMTYQIGDWRYFVEYLDHAQGLAAIKAGGGDPENDTMWDYCDQGEITVCKEFPTKSKAVAWAQRNKKLDVFNMPRVEERTLIEAPEDDLHFAVKSWERTGYWETDGQTEIETD